MGCIEILYGTDGIGGVAKINSNMGCIEILLCEPYYDANGMINSNMGCIEMRFGVIYENRHAHDKQ